MTTLLTPYKCSQISSVSSTPSTSGNDRSFWDTPETPSRQSIRDDFDIATPLTPPLSPESLKYTCEPRVKLEGLSVADHTSLTHILSPDSDHLYENGQSAETGPIADNVTQGELFRNCKDLLLEVAKESSSKPQLQYNLKPSIDFRLTKQSISANATPIKDESSIETSPISQTTLEIGCIIASDTPPIGQYKGLQATLEHIMPSDLHEKLKNYPKLCVASLVTDPSTRCMNGTQIESMDKNEALKAVSTCIGRGNITTLPEKLEKLVNALCCGRHQNVALKQTKAGARIDKLRFFIINLASASEKHASTFRAWTMALANLGTPIPPLCSAPKPSSTKVSLTTYTAMAPVSKDKTPSLLPGFIPYIPTPVSDIDIVRDLKELIVRPLSSKDLESGFIYIFWDQGSFGMVKIGRTNNLKRRLGEWQRCKSTHVYHKASQERELIEVPHVQRVEKLMHKELVNARRKKPCNTCKKTKVHQEWFEVSEAKAIEVFQKWRKWMLSEPYTKNDGGEWVIKPEMIETIPKLCTLEPEAIGGTKTQPRSAKDKSRRPKPRRSFAWQALDASDSVQTPRNVSRGLNPNVFPDVTVAAT